MYRSVKLIAATSAVAMFAAGAAMAQSSSQDWQRSQQQRAQQGMQDQQQLQQRRSAARQQQSTQAGDLTSSEIRDFFRTAENQLSNAVQNNNPSAIRRWTQENLADNATFNGIMQVRGDRGVGAKQLHVISANKQDLVRQQQAMMSIAPELLAAVQDFQLAIDVQNVEPISPGVAKVTTRMQESYTLNPQALLRPNVASAARGQDYQSDGSAALGASADQNQQAQQRSGRGGMTISVRGNALCDHIVHLDQSSSDIVLGMTSCQGEIARN